MAVSFGASKVCAACGQDVSHRPRTRDPRGRYFCTPCYERALAIKQPAKEPQSPRAAPAGDVDDQLLADLIAEAPQAPSAGAAARTCPSCGRGMNHDAVICTNCGFNAQAGRAIQTKTPIEAHEPVGFIRALLWPVYLYFKPDTFFRTFVREHVPALTMFFALLIGLATAADRIDTRAAMSQFSGRPFPIPDQWPLYWAIVCASGVISALLYVHLGGWWYRKRLKFSGDDKADPIIAKRAYIFSWAPMAMPAIVIKLIDTVRYARPSDAWNAPFGILDGLILVCLLWSVWVSFRGVRTLFDTKLVRAVIWFLVLPLTIYGAAIVLVAVAVVATAFVGNPAPAVTAPASFDSRTWRFDYPGNWFIDDSHMDYDPDNFVIVEPVQDAYLALDYRPAAPETPDEMLQLKLEELKLGMGDVSGSTRSTHWGAVLGAGRRVHINVAGDTYEGHVFVAQVGSQDLLVVHEIALLGDSLTVQPGFDMIAATFALKP